MTWFRCGGGGSGIPAALKNRMNAVLNKKFGTAVDYPPNGWPDDVNLLGLLEEKTQASASVCSFDDGADDVPTKSLVVTIPPTLSGVSALNEKQTGKTIFYPMDIEQGSISGSGYNSDSTYRIRTAERKAVTPSTQYKIKVNSEVQIYEVHEYTDLTGSSTHLTVNASEYTFTTKSTTNYLKILFRYSNNATITPSAITELQVTDGDLYWKTYTASLGRTIYGGEVDIVNGVGTNATNKFTVLNTTEWSNSIRYIGSGDTAYIQINNSPASNGRWQDLVCYHFTPANIYAGGTQQGIGCYASQFYIRDSRFTSKQDFLDYLTEQETLGTPLEICYKLATPTDFTFTGQEIPTRLGYNAFWSDSGDTEVTYRGQGTVTPVLPTLISKTITENGTYSAEDDGADGYDEVTVNVSGGGGGSCERLFYARCYDNYQVEIPTISSLVQGTNYSSYVSYSTSTKKFTALQDFTAVIIGWVYTYQTYEASYSQGAFVVNNKRLATYTATGKTQGSTGGAYMVYNFKQGDEFYPYTPSTDGYPRQNCKVYLVSDVPDNIYTFTDENA